MVASCVPWTAAYGDCRGRKRRGNETQFCSYKRLHINVFTLLAQLRLGSNSGELRISFCCGMGINLTKFQQVRAPMISVIKMSLCRYSMPNYTLLLHVYKHILTLTKYSASVVKYNFAVCGYKSICTLLATPLSSRWETANGRRAAKQISLYLYENELREKQSAKKRTFHGQYNNVTQ